MKVIENVSPNKVTNLKTFIFETHDPPITKPSGISQDIILIQYKLTFELNLSYFMSC